MPPPKKLCYVVTQEHYHYPPNESDMVAQRPVRVYKGTDELREVAMRHAHDLAVGHRDRAGVGTVKDHGHAVTPADEYRVWVDFPKDANPFMTDKFVWVVRKTEYVDK